MDNQVLSETEIIKDLAHRHEDILVRLDALDADICSVINEFLGKSDKKDATETQSVAP